LGYRRGFKSEANSIAREVRDELGLAVLDALDPHLLARHLAVPIVGLSELAPRQNPGVRYLLEAERSSFSAVTVFRGTRRQIVHNDAHDQGRQHSNLAHELAHALLMHEPTPALDDHGCRLWNQSIEDEASWLAGALLLPEDAALLVARQNWTVDAAADHFGIST
jgi:Zn-dependent peptidase ImmA (M78 family)